MATKVLRGKRLVASLKRQPRVRDAEALAAWIGRFKAAKKRGLSTSAAKAAAGGKTGGKQAGGKKPPRKPVGPRKIREQDTVLGLDKQPYRDVVPEPTKLKAAERKKLAKEDAYNLITPDTLKSEVLDHAHETMAGVSSTMGQLFPDNPNRWSGNTRFSTIDESDKHYAAFDPDSGDIDVAPYLMEDSDGVKYPTMVHEMFHANTPGVQSEFSRYRGFEEGLAEKLTRLHRRELLTPVLGKDGAESVESKAQGRYDHGSTYQGYIDALEVFRSKTGEGERKFYDDLYGVPLEKRSDYLMSKAGRDQDTLRADDFLRRGSGDFGA